MIREKILILGLFFGLSGVLVPAAADDCVWNGPQTYPIDVEIRTCWSGFDLPVSGVDVKISVVGGTTYGPFTTGTDGIASFPDVYIDDPEFTELEILLESRDQNCEYYKWICTFECSFNEFWLSVDNGQGGPKRQTTCPGNGMDGLCEYPTGSFQHILFRTMYYQ